MLIDGANRLSVHKNGPLYQDTEAVFKNLAQYLKHLLTDYGMPK